MLIGKIKRIVKKASFGPLLIRSFHALRTAPERLLARIAPQVHYQQRKQRWDKRWIKTGFSPSWKIACIPEELKKAVADKWFEPGSAVLDIGCGDGEIAQWLAQKGFTVLGVDYSAPAIERARQLYPTAQGKLSFATMDVTSLPDGPHQLFDGLYDRGCFHVIPKPYATKYAQVVASWARSGAHFLLVSALTKGSRPTRADEQRLFTNWQDYIQSTFEPFFELIRTEASEFPMEGAGRNQEPKPAIVAWLIRR